MNKKVESWLPIFPGFYNTLFEPDNDYIIQDLKESIENKKTGNSEIDLLLVNNNSEELSKKIESFINNKSYDHFKNREYETAVCKKCASEIESILKENNLIKKLIYQKIVSPREYNFYNDSVNIEIVFTKENIDNIKKLISDNSEEWAQYLKDHYTSYDGFWSSFDNFPDSSDWNIDTALMLNHQSGSILQFILTDILDIDSEYLYYKVFDGNFSSSEFFDYDKFYVVLIDEIKKYVSELQEIKNKYQEFLNLIASNSVIIDRSEKSISIPAINFKSTGVFAEKYISEN
jgi:hypothetical protein